MKFDEAKNLCDEQVDQQLRVHAALVAARSRIVALITIYRKEQAERKLNRVRTALEEVGSRQAGPRIRRRCGANGATGLDIQVQLRLKDSGAFLKACRTGRIVRVRAFLQNGGDSNALLIVPADSLEGRPELRLEQTTYGLLEAVGAGHLEVAAKLLASNAHTGVRRGIDGETALHLAVSEQADPRMVQLLLRVSADVGARTTVTRRTSLVYLAASAADQHMFGEALRTEGRDENAQNQLPSAAPPCAGRLRMARLLLDAGAAVSAVDAAGWSASDYARRGEQGGLVAVIAAAQGQ